MNTSKNTVRGGVVGGAFALLLASIANFTTWEQFALWAGTSVGAGIVLWGVVEAIDAAVKQATQGRTELSSNVKFYLAQGLAIAIPVGAYSLELWFHWATWGIAGLIASITTAYQLSQTIHWEKAEADPTSPDHKGTAAGGPITQPNDDIARFGPPKPRA